jgi:Zn-dependent protease with chaperone function
VNGKSAVMTTQRLLGATLCVVGVAMVVSALARGGGPLALGVVLGVPFALLGAARVWLARDREAQAPR